MTFFCLEPDAAFLGKTLQQIPKMGAHIRLVITNDYLPQVFHPLPAAWCLFHRLVSFPCLVPFPQSGVFPLSAVL